MRGDVVDAVIIGSGAGGAPVAHALSHAGLRCVVLEKGRDVPMEALRHDEIRMCRRDFFVPYVHDEPHMLALGDAPATRSNEGWTSNIVGGGTVHMSGYFMRMHPADLRLRTLLGAIPGAELADWPIRYAELEPYYALAERTVGVSGRWRSHPHEEPRSSDYPLPPLRAHPLAERIDAACARLGLHPFPTPRGIASRPFHGRAACAYCATCGSYGCPVGAKASTSVALLPAALATGRCTLRARCMATEIIVDRRGHASGVVYRDAAGVSHFQAARAVVVAASAIESARLLLSSRSSRFPHGLGNDAGLVGRNLVFSGASAGHGVFRHRDDRGWLREATPFVQRSLQDLYVLDTPIDGVKKAGTILFDFDHANPIRTAENIAGRGTEARWGAALKRALRSDGAGQRRLAFETFCEYLPTAGSYVDSDPQVTDRWGAQVARIHVARHPLDHKATALLTGRALDVLRALGADDTRVTQVSGETKFLQGGTCRFGDDPATSVLDRDCRMHAAPSVWVTDGSFLPSSGGVPLTLTILANAFRVGERMASRLRA